MPKKSKLSKLRIPKPKVPPHEPLKSDVIAVRELLAEGKTVTQLSVPLMTRTRWGAVTKFLTREVDVQLVRRADPLRESRTAVLAALSYAGGDWVPVSWVVAFSGLMSPTVRTWLARLAHEGVIEVRPNSLASRYEGPPVALAVALAPSADVERLVALAEPGDHVVLARFEAISAAIHQDTRLHAAARLERGGWLRVGVKGGQLRWYRSDQMPALTPVPNSAPQKAPWKGARSARPEPPWISEETLLATVSAEELDAGLDPDTGWIEVRERDGGAVEYRVHEHPHVPT